MKIYSEKKGFTLVEILVAMFILSIGIMAVVSMMVTSIRFTGRSRAATGANRLVQKQMEGVKSMTIDTTVNKMCDGSLPGFISGSCLPVAGYSKTANIFGNRTAYERSANYQASSTLGDFSVVRYKVVMQKVGNYPRADVDMITVRAEWTDIAGLHKVTALTYMER